MSWLKFLVCFVIFGVIGYFAVEPVSTGSGYFGALLFAQLPVLLARPLAPSRDANASKDSLRAISTSR